MPFMPQWLVFLITLALAKGLVVLGLVLLMRTGLVSFGQGLFYCLGAYSAALLDRAAGINDAALMLLAALAVPAVVALALGFLLASYRGIFFAMLSLAFSMILFGLLIKTSALGSSDGFNVATRSILGVAIADGYAGRVILGAAVMLSFAAAAALHRYLNSHLGRLSAAIRDNELRVEYLGASVRNVVHLNYVIAAALGGSGGGLTAMAVGHIDPDMAYWTTSGEFVFVAVLSGTGNVLAPFFGSAIFEAIRTLASQYAPNVWQMTLGIAMLAIIMFLPAGLWSLFRRRSRTS
jgi:branched-chain amino acid transport system permease protein